MESNDYMTKANHLRFEYLHKPMRAKKGANVSTQARYHHPEMEYIAIRENQRIEQLNSNQSDAVPTRSQLGGKHT
jgi:phosphomethylpyrimidine synthase